LVLLRFESSTGNRFACAIVCSCNRPLELDLSQICNAVRDGGRSREVSEACVRPVPASVSAKNVVKRAKAAVRPVGRSKSADDMYATCLCRAVPYPSDNPRPSSRFAAWLGPSLTHRQDPKRSSAFRQSADDRLTPHVASHCVPCTTFSSTRRVLLTPAHRAL
jgi:hypothetical protein